MMKQSADAPAMKPTVSAAPSTAARNKVAKTQLVDMMAEQTTLSKNDAAAAFDATLEAIVTALRNGQAVGLPGLGTLSVRATAARTGVRLGTSEMIRIPAGRKVLFKVASTLKGTL